MPYFISDTQPGCDGFATLKIDEGGEAITIHCHATKQEAIDQMVAISLKEGLEPGGERALPSNYRPALADNVPDGRACGNCHFYDESNVQGDKAWCERWDAYVDGAYYCNAWRPHEDANAAESDAYRAPAPPEDQITGSDANQPGSAKGAGGDVELGAATQTGLRNKVADHNEAMAQADRPSWTRTTYGQLAAVYRRGSGAYSTSHRPGISRAQWSMARVNAFLFLLRRGRPENPAYISDYDLLPSGHPKSTRTVERAVDLTLPMYIQDAARRGLEFYEAGRGGAGLVARTIRDARQLASGEVSEDKVIRASAWAARHLPDLDAEDNRDPDAPGFPGPGAVAFYLWGINPLDVQPAIDWFARKAQQIRDEERGAIVIVDDATATIQRMGTTVETRRVLVNDFDIRDDTNPDGGMHFSGYAAVFNSDSEPLPFIERISQGAFANSLSSRNEIKMFVNHDTTRVLASKRAGTLRLSEDAHGLRVEADLPPTTDGKDLAILMRRGDVDSMSFGFSVPKGGDSWSPDGATRQLSEVRLHEVSVVTAYPAYAATTAGVRSLENLAAATGADAGALDAAISKLENGETLDDESAMLIESVVSKLRADVSSLDAMAALALKRKQLDLLFSRV